MNRLSCWLCREPSKIFSTCSAGLGTPTSCTTAVYFIPFAGPALPVGTTSLGGAAAAAAAAAGGIGTTDDSSNVDSGIAPVPTVLEAVAPAVNEVTDPILEAIGALGPAFEPAIAALGRRMLSAA